MEDVSSVESKKTKAYIAGPMTDAKGHNLQTFHEAADVLDNKGFDVFNPAEHKLGDEATWEDYMRRDIPDLLKCEAICLLPGWEESRGARMEVEIALKLDMTFLKWEKGDDFVIGLFPYKIREALGRPEPYPSNNPSILQEAQRYVYGPREADYGHPHRDYSKVAAFWSVILDTDVDPHKAALCMVAVKISRELHRPKRDNRVDGAGYFAVADRIAEKMGL